MRRSHYAHLARAATIAHVSKRATLDLLSIISQLEFGADYRPFFVQVGANDGLRGDPIADLVCDRNWNGILVEPQPEAFMRLRENHRAPGLVFENVAIGQRAGTLELYRLRASDGRLYDDLTTCDPERLMRAKALFGFEGDIEKIEVPIMPLTAILDRHDCRKLDVLIVDTEGMDYEVLASLDMSQFAPAIIQCEFIHLGENELKECLKLFSDNDYSFAISYRDMIAYRPTRTLPTKTRQACIAVI